jgi:hypothetical protein
MLDSTVLVGMSSGGCQGQAVEGGVSIVALLLDVDIVTNESATVGNGVDMKFAPLGLNRIGLTKDAGGGFGTDPAD